MQANLAGIHLREEIAAENTTEEQRENAERQEAHSKEPRRTQSGAQRVPVTPPEFFKIPFKALLITPEEAHLFADVLFGVILVFRAQ